MPFFGKRPRARDSSPFGLWFWVFFVGSLALGWFLARETWADWRASRWPKVRCEILASELEQYSGGNGKIHFRARIRYRYEMAGRPYTSDQIRARGTSGLSEFSANRRIVDRFPAGLTTECHVNPQDPAEAVLAPRPDYFLPLIAVGPMLIWAIYEHVAIAEWLGQRRRRKGADHQPLTDMRPRRRWVTHLLLGLITLIFSGTLIGFLVIYPWWRATHADNWVPTPCHLLQSRVETETHHQGWSFKADLVFEYTVNGRTYVSQKPDFSHDLGTSYADTEAALGAFPAGSTNTCYVNPAAPDDAVLRRSWRPNWFLTLFMLAWFGLGCFFTGKSLIVRLRPLQPAAPWETPRGRALAAKPHVELEPTQNPLRMFMLCVAGGITCAVLAVWLGWGVIRSLARGAFDLLPACYALVSAFGLLQSVNYGRRFLYSMLNPSPQLRMSPSVLVPGQKFTVEWTWKGGEKKPRPFRLWLQGREEAYVLTTSVTLHGLMKEEKLEKASFGTRLLAEVAGERFGTREFSLPRDLMPSFESTQARILWGLRVEVLTDGASSLHEHKILVRTPPV